MVDGEVVLLVACPARWVAFADGGLFEEFVEFAECVACAEDDDFVACL